MLLVGCSREDNRPEPLNPDDNVTLKKGNANHYVPFTATFEVFIDAIIHNPPPPPKIQEVLGTGNASHLGKTDLYMKQSWYPPGPPPYEFPWSGSGYGEVSFTAANGDILLADYNDGVGTHISETLVYVAFTGNFKDGGTGRFAHADGFFYWDGIYNPVENCATATVIGEIIYKK